MRILAILSAYIMNLHAGFCCCLGWFCNGTESQLNPGESSPSAPISNAMSKTPFKEDKLQERHIESPKKIPLPEEHEAEPESEPIEDILSKQNQEDKLIIKGKNTEDTPEKPDQKASDDASSKTQSKADELLVRQKSSGETPLPLDRKDELATKDKETDQKALNRLTEAEVVEIHGKKGFYVDFDELNSLGKKIGEYIVASYDTLDLGRLRLNQAYSQMKDAEVAWYLLETGIKGFTTNFTGYTSKKYFVMWGEEDVEGILENRDGAYYLVMPKYDSENKFVGTINCQSTSFSAIDVSVLNFFTKKLIFDALNVFIPKMFPVDPSTGDVDLDDIDNNYKEEKFFDERTKEMDSGMFGEGSLLFFIPKKAIKIIRLKDGSIRFIRPLGYDEDGKPVLEFALQSGGAFSRKNKDYPRNSQFTNPTSTRRGRFRS